MECKTRRRSEIIFRAKLFKNTELRYRNKFNQTTSRKNANSKCKMSGVDGTVQSLTETTLKKYIIY